MRKIISVTLMCLLTSLAYAETAYLYVFFHDDNTNGERFRTQMPDMETCLQALKHSKMPTPDNPSGDHEVIGAMWCGTEVFDRNYNATWWRDPTN